MACVRKRRDKWVIDFYDQFGKRHWETIGTSKKDAEEELAKRLLDVGKNTYCSQNKSRVFGEVEAFAREEKRRGIRCLKHIIYRFWQKRALKA